MVAAGVGRVGKQVVADERHRTLVQSQRLDHVTGETVAQHHVLQTDERLVVEEARTVHDGTGTDAPDGFRVGGNVARLLPVLQLLHGLILGGGIEAVREHGTPEAREGIAAYLVVQQEAQREALVRQGVGHTARHVAVAVLACHAVVGTVHLGHVAIGIVPHRHTVVGVYPSPPYQEQRADVVAFYIRIGAEVLLDAIIKLQQHVRVVSHVQLGRPTESVLLLADDVLRGQRQVETTVAHLADVAVDLGVARSTCHVEVAQQVLRVVVIPVEVNVETVQQLQSETEVGLIGGLPAQRVVRRTALGAAHLAVVGVGVAVGIESLGLQRA